MNSYKTYIKDLKIQIYYLRQFYYNSASSWLKPEIEKCLNSLNNELLNYELFIKRLNSKTTNNLNIQTTIFDFII